MDIIEKIIVAAILALLCYIAAALLKANKQRVLSIATSLVQAAENAITGSGMGAEKKAKVVAQLGAMGVKINAWLSNQIDNIVQHLNDQSGWLAANAAEAAESLKSGSKCG